MTDDGVSLGAIWNEITEVLEVYNKHRTTLASLLRYRTTNIADAISQAVNNENSSLRRNLVCRKALLNPVILKLVSPGAITIWRSG